MINMQPFEPIASKIPPILDQKFMTNASLADRYGVPTKRLSELEQRMKRKLETLGLAIIGLIKPLWNMITPTVTKTRPIGFIHSKDGDSPVIHEA